MRHQSHSPALRPQSDAGQRVAQLRHVLELVEELAGSPPATGAREAALDENARISSAYDVAEPIVRRRFDILAAETAAWSAAGVEALLAAGEGRSPAAAAALADELRRGLSALAALLAPGAARAIP